MPRSKTTEEFIESGEQSRYEIQRSLGRIEGQLNSINNSFVQHMQDDSANFKEVKLKIGVMEKKLWTFGGVFLALGFLITHSDKLLALVK